MDLIIYVALVAPSLLLKVLLMKLLSINVPQRINSVLFCFCLHVILILLCFVTKRNKITPIQLQFAYICAFICRRVGVGTLSGGSDLVKDAV